MKLTFQVSRDSNLVRLNNKVVRFEPVTTVGLLTSVVHNVIRTAGDYRDEEDDDDGLLCPQQRAHPWAMDGVADHHIPGFKDNEWLLIEMHLWD